MGDVSQVLGAIERGELQTAEELVPLVYDELRRLAASRMARETPGHTLQGTALVHEAYLRLVGSKPGPSWEGRRHFFGAAAEAMRRILIENARRKNRLAHGGHLQRVSFDEASLPVVCPSEELLPIHEALEGLAQVDAEAAELVKLRYFVGLQHTQAAEILGVSRRTADSMWAFAKAWLLHALRSEGSPPGESSPKSPGANR